MSELYEIVELPSGEIALQRAGGEGEPLVSIKFSKESEHFLDSIKADVAKAMIEAGLDVVSENAMLEEPEVSDETIH